MVVLAVPAVFVKQEPHTCLAMCELQASSCCLFPSWVQWAPFYRWVSAALPSSPLLQLPTSLCHLWLLTILHPAATYPYLPRLTFTVFFLPLLMRQARQRQLLALLWHFAGAAECRAPKRAEMREVVDGRSQSTHCNHKCSWAAERLNFDHVTPKMLYWS